MAALMQAGQTFVLVHELPPAPDEPEDLKGSIRIPGAENQLERGQGKVSGNTGRVGLGDERW